MFVFLMVLAIIVCILLILIVLVQNPKGGGLTSNFSASNQYMGARKTADLLEKATWTLAIALVVISFLAAFSVPRHEVEIDQPQLNQEQTETPAQQAPAEQVPTEQAPVQ